MNGRYLLDTNIIIALFAEDEAVQRQINLAEEISESELPNMEDRQAVPSQRERRFCVFDGGLKGGAGG